MANIKKNNVHIPHESEGDCTAGKTRGLTFLEAIAKYPEQVQKVLKSQQEKITTQEYLIKKFMNYLKAKEHAFNEVARFDRCKENIRSVETIIEIRTAAEAYLKQHNLFILVFSI